MNSHPEDLKARFDTVLFGLVCVLAATSIALLYSVSSAAQGSEYWKKQWSGMESG